MLFGLPGPATLASVIGCAYACACICILGLLGAPEVSCCGGAAEVASGLFRRSSRGIASEICRFWVPAAGMAVAATAVRAGSALANSSLTATRSSPSLEMMTREVPPDMICKGRKELREGRKSGN
jgi:hypothetical protein